MGGEVSPQGIDLPARQLQLDVDRGLQLVLRVEEEPRDRDRQRGEHERGGAAQPAAAPEPLEQGRPRAIAAAEALFPIDTIDRRLHRCHVRFLLLLQKHLAARARHS
jgi:hypothetical protein